MTTEKILTDDEIRALIQAHKDMPVESIDVVRAIEQAVLQSEQVQAWKLDAGRYRWIRDAFNSTKSSASRRILDDFGLFDVDEVDPIDDVIDDAMEKQK